MRAGCAAFLFLLALAGGIAALGALKALRPLPAEEPPVPPVTAPTPLPDRYQEHVGSLNRFSRTEAGGRYQLSFGFIDHHGRRHDVSCEVSRADHESEADGYGFDEAAIDAAVDARLRAWLAREMATRGLTRYVRVKVEGGRASAEPDLPDSLSVDEHNRLIGEIERFYGLWDGPLLRERQSVEAVLYRERGFLLEGNRLRIDYAGLAQRSRRTLTDCFQALEQAAQGYNQRQFLGLVLAFLQEIRYEVPPDVVGRRRTLGLWVPTEVLVNDHGDCDSKSAAFAAIWRSLDAPVIFVSLPRHMLVGVEVRPGPGEKFARLGNRYFVLCEVAGPGKLHPGARDVSGSFEYVLMEPLRTDS